MHNFSNLSPADFEELTLDLLQAEWGKRLEAFKSGRDGGIDLRCSIVDGGKLIVQCKHFEGSGFAALLRHIEREEARKVCSLAPARYVLVTTVPLSPGNKEALKNALAPYVIDDADILGANDVSNLLRRHPTVEQAHFKLWLTSTPVLQRVLHNAERLQAELQVERIMRKVPLYVRNAAYPRALDILTRERVVVISGLPGVGKTTLADILLLAHLEQGFEPVVVRSDLVEARRLFTRERKQIFYFDDFLGQTFLGPRSDLVGRRQDEAILEFVELASRTPSMRFVLTTREHLLQQALRASERLHREAALLAVGRCVLEVGDYSLLDRARILYNHIHFGDLKAGHKAAILANEFYIDILQHRNFNPRLVEWLSRFRNVQHAPADEYRSLVQMVLERPSQLWTSAFENQLTEAGRSALLALYALRGSAEVESELRPAWESLHRHRATRHNYSTSAEDWRGALSELDGGFLAYDRGRASFVNPSVKDFFDETLCKHECHALDLIASSNKLDTLMGVWSLAASERGGPLAETLRRHPAPLETAIQHLVANDRTGPDGDYVDPERALLAVVRVATTLQSRQLQELAGELAEHLKTRWHHYGADHFALVAVLELMETAEDFWGALLPKLRQCIVNSFADEISWIEGFSAFATYASDSSIRLSADQVQTVREAFQKYLYGMFRDEVREIEDEGGLDELTDSINKVGSWLQVNVDMAQSRITDKLQDIREKPDADAGYVQARWKPALQAADTEDLVEVRRLFGALPTSS